jgi:hypothetical protein
MVALSVNGVRRLSNTQMQIILSGPGGSGERYVERVVLEVIGSEQDYENLFTALGALVPDAPPGAYRHDV